MKNLSPYNDLEIKARADFSDPNRKWREGTTKTSFTYLLLDPRLTNNLPATAGKQNSHLSWATFINSIFYVGKGWCCFFFYNYTSFHVCALLGQHSKVFPNRCLLMKLKINAQLRLSRKMIEVKNIL